MSGGVGQVSAHVLAEADHGRVEAEQLGVCWNRDSWDLARSAYVADLDSDPAGPYVFARWLVGTNEQHAGRTPAERAVIGETVPERSAGRGTSRGHRVGQEVIDAIKQAIVDDWRELGRIVSRSRFVLKAVAASAEAPGAALPTAATTTAAAGPPATPADPAALTAVSPFWRFLARS